MAIQQLMIRVFVNMSGRPKYWMFCWLPFKLPLKPQQAQTHIAKPKRGVDKHDPNLHWGISFLSFSVRGFSLRSTTKVARCFQPREGRCGASCCHSRLFTHMPTRRFWCMGVLFFGSSRLGVFFQGQPHFKSSRMLSQPQVACVLHVCCMLHLISTAILALQAHSTPLGASWPFSF